MDIYLVGGAVRDELLGIEFHEHDYVVVGATADELLAQGFTPVGKDFPVFLHPKTQDEYALARTERKVGAGYTGFECYAQPDVTLEEDLQRRDLTINAIAKSASGQLIDPWGGLNDLQQKTLRHVSPAFAEDPLRVLRAARFAAKLHTLGFRIADETLALMQQLVTAGEIKHLVAERVWQETEKALATSTPSEYFHVLQQCGALNELLPMKLPASIHFPLLEKVSKYSEQTQLRFAAWVADLAPNPAAIAKILPTLATALKAPNAYFDLARLGGAAFELLAKRSITPEEALTFYQQSDAWRRTERFQQVHNLCYIVANSEHERQRTERLFKPVKLLRQVDVRIFVEQGLTGKAIGEAISKKRKQLLEEAWGESTI